MTPNYFLHPTEVGSIFNFNKTCIKILARTIITGPTNPSRLKICEIDESNCRLVKVSLEIEKLILYIKVSVFDFHSRPKE